MVGVKIERNTDLYDFFRDNAPNLLDPEWLASALRPHCKIKRLGMRGSRLRVIQDPPEFAGWLVFLAKNGVRSYLEIGTSTGGSFCVVDSYLRAVVPGYERSVGYDRTAKMRDWDQYKAKFPTAEFRHASSENIDLGKERFDAAFVDARHLEHWVMQDHEKVRHNCRIVGFHDIVLQGSTVDKAWARIKAGAKNSYEFINPETPPEARCGIGVVW
jgi:predicted O-methyltransferase YrrM